MQVFIVATLLAAASAVEVYPTAQYQPAPAYQQAYKTDYARQPHYFSYAVKDEYYNDFGHQETSDGKTVSGSYHVALPDGRIQTVTYSDTGYGLVADVKYEGYAKYPEYKPAYKPATYEAPKVVYEAPKVYDAPKYPAQQAYRPAAPVAYKPAYPQTVAYNKPAYPQAVVYNQPKVVYDAPQYPTQQVYRPAYNPTPVTYSTPAPVAYTTVAPYTTTEYATTVAY